jgi:hypothetical protein
LEQFKEQSKGIVMDKAIEVILNSIIKKVEGFSYDEQSFIFSELSERLTRLSHDALMAEYGMKEEDFA